METNGDRWRTRDRGNRSPKRSDGWWAEVMNWRAWRYWFRSHEYDVDGIKTDPGHPEDSARIDPQRISGNLKPKRAGGSSRVQFGCRG